MSKLYRIIFFLLLAMLCLGQTVYSQNITIKHLKTAPSIDGDISDNAWSKIKRHGSFINIQDKSKKVNQQTSFQVAYDDNRIFFAIRAEEKSPEKMRTPSGNKRDGDLWKDDCFEIYLVPVKGESKFYRFRINCKGTEFDAKDWDKKWNCSLESAVKIGQDYWQAEMSIPFSELDFHNPSKEWKINIIRRRNINAKSQEVSSFTRVIRAGPNPANYATAKFEKFKNNPHLWSITAKGIPMVEFKKGSMNLDNLLLLTNGSAQKVKIEYSLKLLNQKGVLVKSLTGNKLIPASGQKSIPLRCSLINAGKHTVLAEIKNKNGLLLKKTSFNLNLFPDALIIKFPIPLYKDCIFSTQNLKNITFEIDSKLPPGEIAKKQLLIEISTKRKKLMSKTILPVFGKKENITYPVKKLPDGKIFLTATLVNRTGKPQYFTRKIIRKLPNFPGEVWLDKEGICYVNGKPFFPQGFYIGPAKNSIKGYNCIINYKKFQSVKEARKYLDSWHKLGIKVILRPYQIMSDKVFEELFNKRSVRLKDFTKKQRKTLQIGVKALHDHPALLAWYVADEPGTYRGSPNFFSGISDAIEEVDPYHPTCITFCHLDNGLVALGDTCDIPMPDPYPTMDMRTGKSKHPFARHTDFFDVSKQMGKKALWSVPAGFDWWVCMRKKQYIFTRPCNFNELRAQAYLAIIHGAKGFLWYSYGHFFANFTFSKGIPYIFAEFDSLKKAILAKEKSFAFTKQKEIHMSSRSVNGNYYIFAVNSLDKKKSVKIKLKNLAIRKILVLGESRNIAVNDNCFTDEFGPYETHVYTTDNSLKNYPSWKKLDAKITQLEKGRKLEGNILFNNRGLKIKFSSFNSNYQGNKIWEIYQMDALTDGMHKKDNGYCWQDNTPGKYPDWVEFTFPKAKSISRIVVCSSTLINAKIQLKNGNRWTDIGAINSSSKYRNVVNFKKTKVKTFRILVSSSKNGKTEINEVEAYE